MNSDGRPFISAVVRGSIPQGKLVIKLGLGVCEVDAADLCDCGFRAFPMEWDREKRVKQRKMRKKRKFWWVFFVTQAPKEFHWRQLHWSEGLGTDSGRYTGRGKPRTFSCFPTFVLAAPPKSEGPAEIRSSIVIMTQLALIAINYILVRNHNSTDRICRRYPVSRLCCLRFAKLTEGRLVASLVTIGGGGGWCVTCNSLPHY